MGGAAQNISIADMVVFVCLKCDDEALEAREVPSKTKKKWEDLKACSLCSVQLQL